MLFQNPPSSSAPATPARRVRRIIRHSALLSKRVRRATTSVPPPPLPAAFPALLKYKTPLSHPRRSNDFCVALLNEPADDTDAVIVTALDAFPFCCHAELCLMSRAALQDVVRALNARLPTALQIDDTARDVDLRGTIELLVGLRTVGSEAAPGHNVRLKDVARNFTGPEGDAELELPQVLRRSPSPTLRTVREESVEWHAVVLREGSVVIRNASVRSASMAIELRPRKRKISPSILAYNWSSPADAEAETVAPSVESESSSRPAKRARRSPSSSSPWRSLKPRLAGAGFPAAPERRAMNSVASTPSNALVGVFNTLSLDCQAHMLLSA
jgi:hypothetical protein